VNLGGEFILDEGCILNTENLGTIFKGYHDNTPGTNKNYLTQGTEDGKDIQITYIEVFKLKPQGPTQIILQKAENKVQNKIGGSGVINNINIWKYISAFETFLKLFQYRDNYVSSNS
jgi:hypothetical protein